MEQGKEGAGVTLYTVMPTTDTASLVTQMVEVFFPDATSILDMTYGKGGFWSPEMRERVVGLDKDPTRARSVCADFTQLPFRDNAFDLAVFDPPYQTDMGKGKPSVMGGRFGHYARIVDLQYELHKGCLEAARVARLGVLVKCQNYIHGSQLVRMTRWVEGVMPMPLYDEVHQAHKSKIIDPKWGDQLSAYRNHATFLAFRHDGPIHKRRKVAA